MSLGDGFHFAYICILPPQIKPGKYANAEAQVMAEVFIVITSGSSTLQRLRRTRVTATSGRLGVGREERVEAEGVGVGIKVCNRLPFIFIFFFLHQSALIHHCNYCSIQYTHKNLIIRHHTILAALITNFIPSALDVAAPKCIVSQ